MKTDLKYEIRISEAFDSPILLLFEDRERIGAIEAGLLSAGIHTHIVLLYGEDWNKDLSPWPAPRVFKGGEDFAGNAPALLSDLTETALPEIVRTPGIPEHPEFFIAGYSLAGLFAAWAGVSSDVFSGFASVSGSIWFPGFMEYLKKLPLPSVLKRAYFSVGDREAKTKNPVLSSVESCTKEASELLQSEGIDSIFELNEGNHFNDPEGRVLRGLKWLLRP